MISVYIAGPYSSPDPIEVEMNVARAIEAGEAIEDLGLVAFIPHLAHFRHCRRARDYEHWIRVDLEWLRKCDLLLRLPGPSKGSDGEVEEARRCGIPVYCSVQQLSEALEEG